MPLVGPVQRKRLSSAAAVAFLLASSSVALAQLDELEGGVSDIDIEVPVVVLDLEVEDNIDTSDIDLANIVLVAARNVTTVQEAPAIVTIMTEEQLEELHVRNLEQAMDRVPGWMRYGANYSQFPYILSRGTHQAVLLMRDGLSVFEPFLNVASLGRSLPMETIKRIEVVTGPGGVLWGANSFLGVINVISKEAADVDGVEASAGYGTGPGDFNNFRGYVMAGAPDIGGSGVDIFLHTSFESFEAPHFTTPGFLFHSPQPQPNSLALYGPLDTAAPARSTILNLDGSVAVGDLKVRAAFPFVEENKSLTFAGGVVDEELPQDSLPECQSIPENGDIDAPPCIDRGKVGRKNTHRFFDRYIQAEYQRRLGQAKRAGIALRAYGVQFVRRWEPLQIMAPLAGLLPGGLGFSTDLSTYRVGAAADGDFELTTSTRLVYGLEGFREWLPDRTSRSRQGAGAETTFDSPYDLGRLPLPCPNRASWDPATMQPVDVERLEGCPLTFAFSANRVVFGTYASVQTEVTEGLTLDAGLRAQAAPDALSSRPYDPQLLGAAGLVYELFPRWHLKLNYTQGFRPPVFNNTDGNGEAVQIPGTPTLEPERSQAFQGELNARIKGGRSLRELDFRADYSYTILDNLIVFPQGQYQNSGTRGIHSAEFLARLYLLGGHRVEAGYTWMRAVSDELGQLRTVPEQWFNIAVVGRLWKTLDALTALRVVTSFEDPNRLVEYRGLTRGDDNMVQVLDGVETISVSPATLVLDRIPPSADLTLGLRYQPSTFLTLQAVAQNALNALYYQPDPTASFSPRLDIVPNPYEAFRVFGSATVKY